ncbi:CAMK family protein kinase [Histomonas meleagridis]|uniref:CAMK family protein kinase n=1 Tax=Histomonas meleagridis TaxID=135588 RepID=UPI00355A4CA2|nr:CAMK family protein kinase [Histomonas meleagridis]KAH0804701.1 CAMK family protein kinase [Histomonas meleagridis]
MPENVVNTSCGSPHYAAPEVINGKPYDGRAADVWSSGVILYAMLTGSLPFNDPSIRVTIKRIKSGKYVMPIDLDDTIQNLIKRLLTVDADKRITLNQIKNHPAFRIGLPEGYTLPTPLPLPKLDDPIQILPENQVALKVIKRIGFEDLVSLLEENTTNMAKVFFHMMTQPFDPENLPWDSSNLDDENVHPFVSPIDETPFFMFHPELEQQASYGSPFAIPDLIQDSTNSPLFIQEEVIPNIGIDNYELMTKLQWFLRDNSFQWYHPSDRCIIARNAKQNLFITFIATYDEEDEHKINLKIEMAKGTPDYFNAFFREVNSLLSDGIVNEDKQLNEANSFSNDFSDNFSKKSQCNIY